MSTWNKSRPREHAHNVGYTTSKDWISLEGEADAATCSAGGQLVCEKHWTSDNSEV